LLQGFLGVTLLGNSLSERRARLLGSSSLSEQSLSISVLNSSVRVELVESLGLFEVVGLLGLDETGGLSRDEGLDRVGLDDTSDIGVGKDGTGEEVSLLDCGSLVSSSEDSVELLEGGLGPDHETSQVTSGGQEQQVQGVHVGNLNTSQISEGSLGGGSLVSDNDEGTSLDLLGSVPQASLSRGLLGDLGSLNILIGLELGQEGEGSLGLLEGLNSVSGDNQGELGDGRDTVSTGHDEGGDSRCSKGRCNGVSLLVDIDLSVPSSPGAGGGEHSSTSAHVTEGSLSGTVCSTTRDTGNTGDGTTSTPRDGRCLCTSPLGYRVGDSGVFAKVGLNILDNVISDGCVQHGGGGNLPYHLTVAAVYLN